MLRRRQPLLQDFLQTLRARRCSADRAAGSGQVSRRSIRSGRRLSGPGSRSSKPDPRRTHQTMRFSARKTRTDVFRALRPVRNRVAFRASRKTAPSQRHFNNQFRRADDQVAILVFVRLAAAFRQDRQQQRPAAVRWTRPKSRWYCPVYRSLAWPGNITPARCSFAGDCGHDAVLAAKAYRRLLRSTRREYSRRHGLVALVERLLIQVVARFQAAE